MIVTTCIQSDSSLSCDMYLNTISSILCSQDSFKSSKWLIKVVIVNIESLRSTKLIFENLTKLSINSDTMLFLDMFARQFATILYNYLVDYMYNFVFWEHISDIASNTSRLYMICSPMLLLPRI